MKDLLVFTFPVSQPAFDGTGQSLILEPGRLFISCEPSSNNFCLRCEFKNPGKSETGISDRVFISPA
jgi:hypothetical protein